MTGNHLKPRYGSLEYSYAEPIANALVENSAFRTWLLQKTKFSTVADDAWVLFEEMQAQRAKTATTWWRSYFTEKCRCSGCCGQETDLLAVFATTSGFRFALHFEVKQPTDKFPDNKDQAKNYLVRGSCWQKSAPKSVMPHSDFATVLLCSSTRLSDYGDNPSKFHSLITFEEIKAAFPNILKI